MTQSRKIMAEVWDRYKFQVPNSKPESRYRSVDAALGMRDWLNKYKGTPINDVYP